MIHRPAILSLLILLFLYACMPAAAGTETPKADLPAVPTRAAATVTPTTAPTHTAVPSPTSPPLSLWQPGYLPEALLAEVEVPQDVVLAGSPGEAALRLEALPAGKTPAGSNVVPWTYALVAPFPTLTDEVSLSVLKEAWSGPAAAEAPFQTLLVDESTYGVLEQVWGPAGSAVEVQPASTLADRAWRETHTWAIVPFEQLRPRWKVIAIDGQSPVRKDFDPLAYGLTVYFSLEGDLAAAQQAHIRLPEGNRQAGRLTTVVLTGVTALVRGTASLMEVLGMTYPAQDIGGWLREADILHISNEIPFAKNCPQPFDWEGLVFCSQTEYIQLLEDIGTDVVELSGDHFQDWGPEATLYTIELYKERGWQYYGGGINAEDARKPALFEHNGNRLAFIGCNAKEPGYSGATETTPGAVHCDFDRLVQDIKGLREAGYLPIVTFQHLEYYTYEAHPILQEDFRRVASAGAVIVSGSQAHQPHAFEFRKDAFMHYGLGNLFFDQTNQGPAPRTAFIDRHVFYDGRHISTELLTIYLVDYARSRPMNPEERQALLQAVFEASGW